MNKSIVFLLVLTISFFFLLNNTYSVECNSCATCDSELDNNKYIKLNQSINTTSTCINDLTGKSNVTIDCNGYNITCSDTCTGYGIYLISYSNTTIKNCKINGYFDSGIYTNNLTSGTINNTIIENSKDRGIYLYQSENNTITNTTITNISGTNVCMGGICISSSSNTHITNSTINSNSYGIYIRDNSNQNTITENTIINNNKTGIYLDENGIGFEPNYNTITSNKIRNNSIAEAQKYEITIESGADNNNISQNSFKHPINNQGTNIINSNIYADLIVGPSSYYITDSETITGTIALSSPNYLIYAMQDTYNECIDITLPLAITGESRYNTTINCTTQTALDILSRDVTFGNISFTSTPQTYPVINITKDNAHISNTSIPTQMNGISISNSSGTILEYLDFYNTKYSINITSSNNITTRHSTFYNSSTSIMNSTSITIQNNTFNTFQSPSWMKSASSLYNTNDSTITNNTYTDIKNGIDLYVCTNTNITGNTFTLDTSTEQIPIIVHNSTSSTISYNTIDNAEMAVMLDNTDSITIDQNTITNITRSVYSTAIELTKTNNSKITNNTINDSKNAILIRTGNTNTIYNNTIRNIINTSIQLWPDEYKQSTTAFHNNTIEKNTIENTGTAISLNNTYNTLITQNTIKNTTSYTSLYIVNSSQDNITHNTFDIGQTAIELRSASNDHIQSNTFDNYTTFAIDYDYEPETEIYNNKNTIKDNQITGGINALYIRRFTNGKITNNTITSAINNGIFTTNTEYTNITNNTIKYSRGIELFVYSDNIIIDNNTIGHITGPAIKSQYSNPNLTISNNLIQNTSQSSINIQNAQNLKIKYNLIENLSSNAIDLYYTQMPTIEGNTITNEIKNTSKIGLYIQNTLNATIKNNTFKYIYWSGSYGAKLQNISNSNITNNIFKDNRISLSISFSSYNNISENTFENNTDKALKIESTSSYNNISENTFKSNNYGLYIPPSLYNNLWMNNFSDNQNTFSPGNDYCIIGLDNYYHESQDDSPPLSCEFYPANRFNDTTIYINDTIKFTTNTTESESSIASLNVTIDSTNYTMTLTEGDNIKGLWTYELNAAFTPGTYYATQLHYYETDNDRREKIITENLNFTVTELNIATNITPNTTNIGETTQIEATIQGNATPIDHVTSRIYWNNTLIETRILQYDNDKESPPYYYNNTITQTNRSGEYTVNTTIKAGLEKNHTNSFYINYGESNLTINNRPNTLAYDTNSTQNYTIKADWGDLNNITVTFNSSNTSVIEITSPTQHIPYLNYSDTESSYINITAKNEGTADITITVTPENGTNSTQTKDIEVRIIQMIAYPFQTSPPISETNTIRAEVWDNATEITNVTAEIYWNNTLKETFRLEYQYSMGPQRHAYENTTNTTQRSGNYTVNVTAYATNTAKYTTSYYINYGTPIITIHTTPSSMNTGTQKTQYANITAIGGDLKDLTAAMTIDNTSKLNLSSGEQSTKTKNYLNISDTWTISWQLDTKDTPNATINITADAYNTIENTSEKTIRIKELTLYTSLNATTTNITNYIRIYANITGNITILEYVTANITWNQTSKQNITLHLRHYYPDQDIYQYTGTITNTDRSGYYHAFTEAKSEKTINTTKTFFINYGTPKIEYSEYPKILNISENATQTIFISPVNGDLANVTITLISNNESVLNLSVDEIPKRTIKYLKYTATDGNFNENKESINYNITGIILGITNISTNVTSEYNTPAIKNKSITVTGDEDTNTPNVTAIWTNSTINTYNLLDIITIYATIEEDRGFSIVYAEITKPGGYKKNLTMTQSGTGGLFSTVIPFTNTTEINNHTTRIYAIDTSGNTNDTEKSNFTITNIYPTTIIDTETLYNRGENATITITVYDVNNNKVTGFNTTLNITYESNTTNLLNNNDTSTYSYYIDTYILGIHNITTNITKYENKGSNLSRFNTTNTLDMSFYTTFDTYQKATKVREFELDTFYARGTKYLDELNTTLYCYNDSSGHSEIVPLIKSTENSYTYTTNGDPQCYASTSPCVQFEIKANITDSNNNTGTKSLFLNTYGCDSPPGQPSSPSNPSSSSGIGYITPTGNNTNTIIIDNTNISIINDFSFTLNKNEIIIEQGEDATIIAALNNLGETKQYITAQIIKECCNISLEDTTFTIPTKNKKDIPIQIHSTLMTTPGEYLATITMRSENITKTETITIKIEENTLIKDLRSLETSIIKHQNDIETYSRSGLNINHLQKSLEEYKSYIESAKDYIEKDDLKNLKITIEKAKDKSNYITRELLKLKTMRWLSENRYNIIATTIATIFLAYILIYFIIPYTYLKKDLAKLRTKEKQFKDAEKTVQKQYFMRQLDESTFSKLMSEKHSHLLDTRSQIKGIEEKIELLKKGKLNLKEESHNRYFILSKLTAPKKIRTENKDKDIEEKIKTLKEQEFNINQSIKEAEKNYYSRIITQEELEQIIMSYRSKLKQVTDQLTPLEELQGNAPTKQEPTKSIFKQFRQRLNKTNNRPTDSA